eukprot:2297263-Prymnesium_polylepis.1
MSPFAQPIHLRDSRLHRLRRRVTFAVRVPCELPDRASSRGPHIVPRALSHEDAEQRSKEGVVVEEWVVAIVDAVAAGAIRLPVRPVPYDPRVGQPAVDLGCIVLARVSLVAVVTTQRRVEPRQHVHSPRPPEQALRGATEDPRARTVRRADGHLRAAPVPIHRCCCRRVVLRVAKVRRRRLPPHRHLARLPHPLVKQPERDGMVLLPMARHLVVARVVSHDDDV